MRTVHEPFDREALSTSFYRIHTLASGASVNEWKTFVPLLQFGARSWRYLSQVVTFVTAKRLGLFLLVALASIATTLQVTLIRWAVFEELFSIFGINATRTMWEFFQGHPREEE